MRNCRAFLSFIALTTLSAAAVLPGRVVADEPASGAEGAKPKDIYDTKADANVEIAAALAEARRDNRRVLLMFGGNWCGWCHKLHGVFKENGEIAKTLLYEYRLVLVDIGRRDKHLDVAGRYGANLKKNGVPFLTVLDGDGKVLVNQETGSLEAGPGHDPAKVAAFLDKWKATPRDAEQELAAALAEARAEQKLVFLWLSAPRCPWCHKLEAFVWQPSVAEILGRDFINLKIDVDRMKNGKKIAKQFRPEGKGGIPWFAFIDPDGKVLATSDAPEGNVGFPVTDAEVRHFINMLKQTAQRISADQIEQIQAALKAAAPKKPQD